MRKAISTELHCSTADMCECSLRRFYNLDRCLCAVIAAFIGILLERSALYWKVLNSVERFGIVLEGIEFY